MFPRAGSSHADGSSGDISRQSVRLMHVFEYVSAHHEQYVEIAVACQLEYAFYFDLFQLKCIE